MIHSSVNVGQRTSRDGFLPEFVKNSWRILNFFSLAKKLKEFLENIPQNKTSEIPRRCVVFTKADSNYLQKTIQIRLLLRLWGQFDEFSPEFSKNSGQNLFVFCLAKRTWEKNIRKKKTLEIPDKSYSIQEILARNSARVCQESQQDSERNRNSLPSNSTREVWLARKNQNTLPSNVSQLGWKAQYIIGHTFL